MPLLISYSPYEEITKTDPQLSQAHKVSKCDEAPQLPEVKAIYEAGQSQTDELLNEVITVEQWAICPHLTVATGRTLTPSQII